MGEAKRRGVRVKGPYSYELAFYRIDEILERAALAILRDETPSQRANEILCAIIELKKRLENPRLKPMLCMTCDYEFRRDERPVEVALAFPFANRRDPAITSVLCPKCAALDNAAKQALALANWRKIDPHAQLTQGGQA
jgi:hypothetical protein